MTTPVMAYPQFAPSEQDAYREQFDAGLQALPAGLGVKARQVLDNLSPVEWPVEWHLPWWLGQEFGLSPQCVQTLTLCNLFGLGYVRIEDEMLEESAGQAGRQGKRRLADALYDQAMLRLNSLFSDQGEFWGHKDLAMSQWQRALDEGEHAPVGRFADWTENDMLLLAWRGAPIKITAVGACLLAGYKDAIPALLASLDHMLIAQVLLDHLDDWSADLDAGRFNAFVAFASDLPQTAQFRDANRRQVMQEFFLGDAGASYVDLTRRHIQTARCYAQAVPCSGLGHYLAGYDSRIAASELALRSEIRGWLHHASAELFALPEPIEDATPPL
jgi:hypothetical protein